MSSNIFQIYTVNPASSMQNSDLFYLGRNPYGTSSDYAILWSNVVNSLKTQLPIISYQNITSATQSMAGNAAYIANNAGGNVVFTLPLTITVGQTIDIIGAQNGWSIAQNIGQQIHIQSASTTMGAGGSISSNTAFDGVRLICTVDNSIFTGIPIGNLTIV